MQQKLLGKVLSCILVLTVSIGIMACGNQTVNQKESSNSTQTEGAKKEDNTEKASEEVQKEREYVELVVYNYTDGIKPGMEETIEAVNKYLKEKLNTTLDMHIYKQSEYVEVVPTILSSGTYMDMVLSGADRVPFPTFASQNAFMPIEDYVDEYLTETKKLVPEEAWDAYTINGHLYAVPLPRDYAQRFSFQVNQTLLDDIGVTFPEKYTTSWDLVDFLYEVKEARDAKYPDKAKQPIMKGVNNYQGFYFYEKIVANNELVVANIPGLTEYGYKGMGNGETVFCPYYTEEYREYAKLMNKFVKDGIVPYSSADFDTDKVLNNAGELLGGISVGYVYVDENSTAPYYKTAFQPASAARLETSGLQAGGLAISAQSKHVERCLEVIDLLNSDEYLATVFRFGPEGVGWTDNDNDGVIELTDINKTPNSADRFMYYWYGWNLGGLTVSKIPEGQPENFTELLQEMTDNATAGANIGFIMDMGPVENEIAACANVVAEYNKGILQTGQMDNVDELVNEFIAKLKANGMDKIVEEAQKQLNDWRAAKGLPTK